MDTRLATQLTLQLKSWPDRWELGPSYESTAQWARYLGPRYIKPAEQIAHDVPGDPLYPEAHDPHPQFVLSPVNEDGDAYVHRSFEYGLYGGVRGTAPSTIASWRQKFVSVGNPEHLVC